MNSTQTAQPIYQTLNSTTSEIRVIRLQQDSGYKDLRCTLETVSLDDQPEFHALSYVWGTEPAKDHLNIGGNKLLVAPRLATVLLHLRHHHYDHLELHSIPLWIDAICINQADIGERAQQVRLMQRIYGQASRVLVWIGGGDEFSDAAMDRINDPAFPASLEEIKTASRAPTAEEVRISAITRYNLEYRPYWTRAWTLQEFVLATQDPVVLCGSTVMLWSWYQQCASFRNLWANQMSFPPVAFNWRAIVQDVMRHNHRGPMVSTQRHRGIREYYQENGSVSLALALGQSIYLGATDPRDLIYGVLGLVPHHERALVNIDYEVPPEGLFTATMAAIWTSGTPGLIGQTIPRLLSAGWTHDKSKVPSWVPDVLNKTETRRAHWEWIGSFQPLEELIPWEWRPEKQAGISVEGSILTISAIQFDHIAETLHVDFNHGWGAPFRRGKTPGVEVDIEPLQKIEAMAQRGFSIPVPASGRLAPFLSMRDELPIFSALTAWEEDDGCFDHDRAARRRAQLEDWEGDGWLPGMPRSKPKLWEILLGRQDIPEGWKMACSPEQQNDLPMLEAAVLEPLLRAIRRKLDQKRVFTTRCGFLGVGTKYVEAGDVIALIAGMTMMYVLRPFRDGYRMVGFADISGLMDWDDFDEAMAAGTLHEERIKVY